MTYTPTTDEVDTGFTSFAHDLTFEEPDAYGADSGFEDYHEVCAAFRRWLEVERAKVWDEAIAYVAPDDVEIVWAANPYRKETP